MMLHRASVMVLTAALLSCQQCQTPPAPSRGNVDRVTDVVLVENNEADGVHSYAVFANPELSHLRVLDLTADAFVVGPNRFFPLSLPVGPNTRALDLAVDPTSTTGRDDARVFALDTTDNNVMVFCTPSAVDCPAWSMPSRFETPTAPFDIASVKTPSGHIVVTTHPQLAATSPIVVTLVDAAGALSGEQIVVALPSGPEPFVATYAAVDATGQSIVVADAQAPRVAILRVNGSSVVFDRMLTLRTAAAAVTTGILDVGDGLAPVALVLSADASEATALRLYRPGRREDGAVVLGSVELPAPPATAFVPDQRMPLVAAADDPPPVVCCRGLSEESLPLEATRAFGSVWMSDGRLLHLRIDNAGVRFIDDDPATVGARVGVDLNGDASLWGAPDRSTNTRPAVTATSVDNYGTPPHRPLVIGQDVVVRYQPDIVALTNRDVTLQGADTFTIDVAAGVVASTAAVGDAVRFLVGGTASCASGPRVLITEISPEETVRVALTDAERSCLLSSDGLRVTVEAATYVATVGDRVFGRVIAGGPALELPGVALSLVDAAAGPPPKDSKLVVPLDGNLITLGLDLAKNRTTTGGFGLSALVPTAIAGGTVRMPGINGVLVRARRMVMTTGIGGADLRSLVLFADQGETTLGRVDSFR
jgi:hypothetical protein